MITLFNVQNKKVIPSEHCYSLRTLRIIMEQYPDNYMKIYAYVFYMTCPNPDLNPFFHYPEKDKEDMITREVEVDFSTDDIAIIDAVDLCASLYETETSRAYYGIKKALDSIATYMATASITDGRDGNISQIVTAAMRFDAIRQSYKGVYKDLMEEQISVRGQKNLAYDG